MFNPLTVIIVFFLYAAFLFLIAMWAERKTARGKSPVDNPVVYSLSLAVYCTAWMYYGSVGKAATSGMLFLAIYLGPVIAIILWWTVLRKLVRIKNAHRITSIADFISARYDRSEGLAALVTLAALVGIMPYIALQLKAILSTFAIITIHNDSATFWTGRYVGPIVVGLMIVFTIVFGVRRLDPTERHEGMIMALAVECLVKLVGFLAAGIFVTYFMYDGFADIFQRLSESPFHKLASIEGADAPSYLMWTTYIILAMSAILLLPRQFHTAVVENYDEKHILTAMWLFPLYMLLINIFVFPIAVGGLLMGLPVQEADTFLLQLPLDHGKPWLVMLVFIGGVSAATGMIMISTMTLSTMITNHLLLPLMRWVRWLSFLRRHLLKCKWAAVAVVLMFGYWFERQVGESYMLVHIGLISFAAMLQFAPAVLGGLFWHRGNKAGAFLGLSSGFLVWFYTLFLPSFVRSGWIPVSLLEKGPWGMAFLRPEQLFGLTGFDPLTHTVFWTLFFNISLYVLGSLYFRQSEDEQSIAEEFTGILADICAISRPVHREAYIDLESNRKQIMDLLSRYFTDAEIANMMDKSFRALGLEGKTRISITDLVKLLSEVEKFLAGAIGTAAAHKAMAKITIFTPRETRDLMDVYREVLTGLRVKPEDLIVQINYYQEKEALLTSHAEELQQLNNALELHIEELREAQKALGESEKKYRGIFEGALEGIFQSTSQGRFISASPSMASILGYDSPKELIDGVTDIGSQLYVDPLQWEKLFHLLQEQDTVRNFECRLYRKDRSLIWGLLQGRAMRDSKGEVIGLEGFIQDISERKRAKEALQDAYKELEKRVEQRTAELRTANEALKKAKDDAEAATRAKSEFLANMSHEIRTPMNGVIAAADLALSEKLTPKAKHYLEIIHSSGYSLLGIINDILDFSKIEAGKLALESRPFRLDEVSDLVIGMSINKATEKGIEILVDIDPETPKALIGDSMRLQQILTNLLSNAVKFTRDRGDILIGVKFLEKSLDQAGLGFFVKDTGIGIASEYLPNIFDSFTQADTSITRRYEGTGLGLAICKQLVQMMQGKIRVESELGKGSTFTFTARFGRQPLERERKFVPPSDIQYLNVLVVDDCGDSRVIMQKMLESFGFRVKSVSSGEESLHMLEKNLERGKPFDLVMMDWLMPGLDGIEASRRIRKDLKLTTPIIIMTAFGKVNEKMEAERAGVNGFLTKPVYQSTLFNAIMDAFGKVGIRGVEEEKYVAVKVPVYKERLKGLRILVVEDNPVNQEIAKAILEKAEIIVDVANNGEEALDAVRRTYFDAVLMDIQMPKMDGYEATRTIRKDPKFTSLPIIAMTAHAMKGDEEKCLEAGMDAYVSKPVSQERLFRALWELIKPGKRPEYVEEVEVERPSGELERLVTEAEELPVRLPGINIQEALKSLNISNDVFKRILMGFLKNNRDTGIKIRDALERKDWESILHLAHSLKGSAGNIGAKKLYKNAQELETASREAKTGPPASLEGISDLIDKVQASLNEVLESLASLVEIKDKDLYEKERGIKLSADPAQILPVLNRLADALELADPAEIKKHMDALGEYLGGAIFRELEGRVNAYDYDEALETLKGMVEKIKATAAEKGDDNENR